MLRCSYDYLEIIDSHPIEQHASDAANMTQTPNPSNQSFGYNPARPYKDVDIFENFLSIYKIHHSYLIQTPDMGIITHKTTNGNAPRRICGDWNSKVKLLRYRSSGPILGLHFSSDYSHHFSGYKAKVVIKNGKLSSISSFICNQYSFILFINVTLYELNHVCLYSMCKLHRNVPTID